MQAVHAGWMFRSACRYVQRCAYRYVEVWYRCVCRGVCRRYADINAGVLLVCSNLWILTNPFCGALDVVGN